MLQTHQITSPKGRFWRAANRSYNLHFSSGHFENFAQGAAILMLKKMSLLPTAPANTASFICDEYIRLGYQARSGLHPHLARLIC